MSTDSGKRNNEEGKQKKNTEKKLTRFMKTFQLSNFQQKQMAFKLFEFLEQFMIENFIKLTQFEKTGSIDKNFVSLGNLIIKFHF